MALDGLFKLAKLTIRSYPTKEDRAAARKARFPSEEKLEVMYNPESLSTRHESTIGGEQAASGHAEKTVKPRGREVTVKLVFDGTDVSHFGIEQLLGIRKVSKWVALFLSHCYDVKSDTHEPQYLNLQWGGGLWEEAGLDCRLASVDINYPLFDRDGSPLRAELTAKFIEDEEPKKVPLSSPDLTHRRVVRDGDTLPTLCREIYGSPAHYLLVARYNELDHPRDLEPGRELLFPPLDPTRRS